MSTGSNITLGEFKARVRYRCDAEGILDRHPELDLDFETNASLRMLRQKLANNDVNMESTPTTEAALPTTEAISGCGYAEVDWPVEATRILGLDVKIGSEWWPIDPKDFAQRRQYIHNAELSWNYPDTCAYIPRKMPTQTNSTRNVGKIMIIPVPTTGRYVLWYLPEWTVLDNDNDLCPGQEMWIEWAIWDVCVKLLVRDNDPDTQTQLNNCKEERDRVWLEIKNNAMRVVDDAASEPINRYGRNNHGPRVVRY